MRVAVIGCGMISHTHIPFIQSYQGSTQIAVADFNADMMNATADRYGISNRFTDVERLIEEFKPNVVHILTPPQSHLELTKKFADAGCHIFLEKPMCLDAKEAREIAEYTAGKDVKLCVDHNFKFDPFLLDAKKMLADGVIGKLCGIESYYGFDLAENKQSRYYREAYTHWGYRMPGGLYQNLIDHPLYQVLDYIPNPTKIEATSHEYGVTPGGVPDELRILLDGEQCSAYVTVSLAVSPRAHTLTLQGLKGTIFVDFVNQYNFLFKHRKGPRAISRVLMNFGAAFALVRATIKQIVRVLLGKFTTYPGTEILIHRFYQSIANNTDTPVSLDRAIKVLEVGDIVWKKIDYPKF